MSLQYVKLVCLVYMAGMTYFLLRNNAKSEHLRSARSARSYADAEYQVQENEHSTVSWREKVKSNIAILIILKSESEKSFYKTAIQTVKCYAAMQNYQLIIASTDKYKVECRQKSYWYKRHCVVASILGTENYNWIMFLEPGIAVMNPSRRIEDFIVPTADLILYEKLFSWEIMSGSYLVKKSEWSVTFLRELADFEGEVSSHKQESDGAALHAHLVETLQPNTPFYPVCVAHWGNAADYPLSKMFKACTRHIIGSGNINVVIKKQSNSWCRESWLTNGKWSDMTDFMFSGRSEDKKMKTTVPTNETLSLKGHPSSGWYDHVLKPLDIKQCKEESYEWDFNPHLLHSPTEIRIWLDSKRRYVQRAYINSSNQIRENLVQLLNIRF